MSDTMAPFLVLSDDNHGPLISLVSVALLITAAIFVTAKLGSVIYFKQRRTMVNTPIWIALVLAIIQVVLMQKSIDHGVGRHMDTLTAAAINTSSKFYYAAHLIEIFILSLSKLSTTLLVLELTPNKGIRLACNITIGVTVAWTVFAFFGLAFQCEMPKPWLYRPGRCTGKGAIFYPISVFHILSEIVIIAIPFYMMRNVQMVWQKRFKILCSFSARLSVVGLAIAQLVLIPPFLRSQDITWDIVNPTICGQAMMCVSLTIACLPTLYHIFAGLHSGLITTRLSDEVELTHGKRSAYINSSIVSGSGTGQGAREQKRRSTYTNNARFGNIGSSVVTDIATSHHNSGDSGRRSSSESTRHLTQDSKRDGVLKTVDITVEVEDDHSRSFSR